MPEPKKWGLRHTKCGYTWYKEYKAGDYIYCPKCQPSGAYWEKEKK